MQYPISHQPETFHGAGIPANTGPYDVLVVGASLGGPPAVEALLQALPADLPIPVAVCQHMAPGFTATWAERLGAHCSMRVQEAQRRDIMQPGVVYIGPAGLQMRIRRDTGKLTICLDPDFADSLHVPSIDILFSSAAAATGTGTLAVLMTGMGSDGANGMLAIRQAGGYTIAESQTSAVSYSMPGSAVNVGAVVETLDLKHIPHRVAHLGATR